MADEQKQDDTLNKKSTGITRVNLYTDNFGRLVEERIPVWGVMPKNMPKFQSRGYVNIEVHPLGLPGAKIGVKFAVPLDFDDIAEAFKALPGRMAQELERAKRAGVEQYRDTIKKQPEFARIIVPKTEDILRSGGATTLDIQWGKRT